MTPRSVPAILDVTFDSGDICLAGVLALPAGGDVRAAVVMVGGSGPADRHNDTYFPLIRPRLLTAGIAVLSYDKRGVGGSTGDWRDSTLDELATDAIAAVEFLRGRGIGPAGLFGHSEGGWVVLRAAARVDVPWVITNSCPGMTPAVQDRFALHNAFSAPDASAADVERALAVYDAVVDAGRRGSEFADVSLLVERADDPAGLMTEYWAELDAPTWTFLRRKQDHDPLPDQRALRCPHLAIYGGVDRVVPVPDSVALLTALACEPTRNPQATLDVAIFPGTNHRMQTVTGELAPGYQDALVSWILRRQPGAPRS
jgi:pimeloyl-ACP methyl ester carboxylesterase